MIIPINTTQRMYFRQCLELLKPLPPINKLNNKELDVLGEFLYRNYKLRDIEQSLRKRLLFDYDTRLEIREYLNTSEAVFNNIIYSLKKKGILKGDSVISTFGIDPEHPDIQFKFNITE